MTTLTNGLTVSQSDLKEFILWKKENFQKRLQHIKKLLDAPEHIKELTKNEAALGNIHGEMDLLPTTGICFYIEPSDTAGVDLEGIPLYNEHAVSIFGNEMEFLKTFSDFDKASQEMNLACMSGQFDNILYPNNNETLFGITFNETCGEYIDYFRIPEGIHVPDNSTMNFKVRIKMDRQVDSEVFRLLPGNSGIRFDDLVGVMGTVSLIIYYTDLHTGQQIKAKVNRTFLDKFKSSDTPLIGHYEDTIQVSVNLPVTVDIFGRTPLYQIITVINISTYTGKNFKPGEVLQTARQYALVDFRKLGSISPEITPDIAKRGAGGGHLQWYKVCFPSATEE